MGALPHCESLWENSRVSLPTLWDHASLETSGEIGLHWSGKWFLSNQVWAGWGLWKSPERGGLVYKGTLSHYPCIEALLQTHTSCLLQGHCLGLPTGAPHWVLWTGGLKGDWVGHWTCALDWCQHWCWYKRSLHSALYSIWLGHTAIEEHSHWKIQARHFI